MTTTTTSEADESLSLVRTEFRNLHLRELLQQSPRVLLGVTAEAEKVLDALEVDTVFDLATSGVFNDAAKLVEGGTNLRSALYQRGAPSTDVVRESVTAGKPISELQFLPIKGLERIPEADADKIQAVLDVQTIRDLALYPPFRAAVKLMNAVYFPENAPDYDPERPADLLPKSGDYPTERVQYSTLLLDEIPLDDGVKIIDVTSPEFSPIDLGALAAADAGFKKTAFGALLTFNQSWYAQGVTLGQLLHSTSLAPGESTRVAVIDWSRKSRAGETEVIDETDDLTNDQSHNRSISEVTRAVANEAQGGFSSVNTNSHSTQSGTSSAMELSAPLGGLLGGPSFSMGRTSSRADSSSKADSYSSSWGHRDLGSTMMQNINDRTHQHAHSNRSRRASVVKEVSQTEHESVSTRVIANYNHMHALTIQYYEVVQIYRVEVAVAKADRVVFIPFQLVDFNLDGMVRRFQNVLAQAALTYEIGQALQALDTLEVALDRNAYFTVLDDTLSRFAKASLATTTSLSAMRPASVLAAPATSEAVANPDTAEAPPPEINPRKGLSTIAALSVMQQMNEKLWTGEQASRLAGLLNLSVLRANSTSIFLPTDVFVEGASIEAEGFSVRAIFRDLNNRIIPEVSSESPVAMNTLGRVSLSGGSSDYDISAEVVLTLNRNGVRFPLELPRVRMSKDTRGETRLFQVKVGGVDMNLKKHLMDHRMYYSQAVFRSLDASQTAMLLSGFGVHMKTGGKNHMVPVAQVVEPRPIRIIGNYLAFKMNSDASSDETWAKWLKERGIRLGSAKEEVVPLATGGTFAEAVLGRSNCAEKLDITRFWNWQDSPIPLQPSDIAAIQTGTRATPEDVKPGQLSNPIVNITSPTSLPDPTGTAAVLAAIQNGNMFRDMSGLQATIGLAQAALQATAAGASTAGEQAGTNMNNLLKANTERQRIAAEMITSLAKTAASMYTGGLAGGGGGGISGGGNHSQDGAKVNYFDKAKGQASGASGSGSGGGGGATAPQGGGGSDAGGDKLGSGIVTADYAGGDTAGWSRNPAILAATWGDGAPRSSLIEKAMDYGFAGDASGLGGGGGGTDTATGETTVLVSPFPSAYPSAISPDSKLQQALDNARAGLSDSQKKLIANVPITIIALSGGSSHPIASFRGDEMDYSASLLKIAAMYAAYELRAAAQRLADAAKPGSTQQLIALMKKQFDPAIKGAVPRIVGAAGIKDKHVLPSYDQVCQLNNAGKVEFTLGYTRDLSEMIVGGHNPNAMNCIHGLGYGYINGALASAGFFDGGSMKGIWLCGDFMQDWPYVRVASLNDQGVAQATTTDQMARLFALIADGALPGSTEMQALLEQAGRWFHNPAEPPEIWGAGEPVRVTHAKVGLGPLKSGASVASEGEIVLEKSKNARFAVTWQNLKGGATRTNLQAVAKVIKDAIEAFVGP